MAHSPLVSVVICNYNYAAYLGQAIESVLDQTYRQAEVVVVDDGSTDQSAAVLARYARQFRGRVRPIYTQNRGQTSALRMGVLASQGEIICFLDSDDLFFAQKLATVVAYMHRFRADGLVHRVWLFGAPELHHQVHTRLGQSRVWPYYGGPRRARWVHNRVSIDDYSAFYTTNSGIVLRRELAVQIASFRAAQWRYTHYGDVYFDRPAQVIGRVLFIPELLAGYRIHHLSHHLDNLNVRGHQQWRLQQNLLAERYAYVNSLLTHYGYEPIDLYRNLRWLDLAVRNGMITARTYLAHCWRTRPPAGWRASKRIWLTLRALQQAESGRA